MKSVAARFTLADMIRPHLISVRVLRPFIWCGRTVQPGELVKVSDLEVESLENSGRAARADGSRT